MKNNDFNKDGFINVIHGKIYYRIYGDSKTATKTPIVFVHGGPGFPYYGICEEAKKLSKDRLVIYYDQLGCGHSTINKEYEKDDSLWVMENFAKELDSVIKELDLGAVHVAGASFGVSVVVDYILAKPKGVKSLILSSPLISAKIWSEDAKKLKEQLPKDIYQIIQKHETEGSTESDEYLQATSEYYKRYLSRKYLFNEILEKFTYNFNENIYNVMWGPNEFLSTGTLKDYDRTPDLPTIDVPTLFTCGRYDEATPESVHHFHSLVKGSEIKIFENSAHMTMLDEPVEYFKTVSEFIRKYD